MKEKLIDIRLLDKFSEALDFRKIKNEFLR